MNLSRKRPSDATTRIEKLENRRLMTAAYTAIDIGSLGGTTTQAYAVNANGQVVGQSATSGGAGHAFLLTGGVLQDLGTLGGTTSVANGINDSGVVVGASDLANGSSHAFVYTPGGSMVDLGTLGGGGSVAWGVNASGEIVGDAQTTGGDYHAVSWINGAITDLGTLGGTTSVARGINAGGDIFGYSLQASGQDNHAFVLSNATHAMTDAGTLGGKESFFYNGGTDSGTAYGDSALASGQFNIFSYTNGKRTKLGNLGGTDIFAYAANNSGTVVGEANLPGNASVYHAYAYNGGTFSDLNSQIDPGFSLSMTKAWGVNSTGTIVGEGTAGDGSVHAFELTPAASVPTTSGLTVDLTSVNLPNIYIPGDAGTAKIIISNPDTIAHRGTAGVQLYLSSDGTLDSSDAALTAPTLARAVLNLAAGKSKTLTARFVVPANAAPGGYQLLAKLVPGTITSSDLSTTVAAAEVPGQLIDLFGTVGSRHGVKLTRTLADGTSITYAISGPGTGLFTDAGNGQSALQFTNTTLSSGFRDDVRGGSNSDFVTSFETDNALGFVTSSRLHLVGTMHIAGSIKGIQIASTAGTVQIDGTNPVSLILGAMSDANVVSTAGIKSLQATAWTYQGVQSGILTAPWVGSLRVAGEFGPAVTLGGAGAPGGVALGRASIGGNVENVHWAVGGGAGTIAISGGVPAGFSCNIAGALKTLTVQGGFAGDLAATGIGNILIGGTANAAHILAGTNFGADGVFGGGDDTFVAGSIRSLVVRGNASSSVFAGGVQLIGDVSSNDTITALPGGSIRVINFGGTLSSDSRVAAAALPARVPVAGVLVTTATDPRFTGVEVSGK